MTTPGKPPTQKALAVALGMSQANVTKLKKQGMPVHSVEAARAWRTAKQNIAARKPDADAPIEFSGLLDVDADDLASMLDAVPQRPAESHDKARTRREIAEANLAELREAEMQGDLIRVDAVKTTLATVFATTRDALLQIPDRLAPLMAAETDATAVHTLLHAEIHQALHHLSGAADRIGTPEASVQ